VFSINAAYRRREDALKSLASIKANIVSLAFAARDWTPNTSGQTDLKAQTLPSDLFRSSRAHSEIPPRTISTPYTGFSLSGPDIMRRCDRLASQAPKYPAPINTCASL
tara:strand:+ start:788 stop:1111 length:324 start_codon:yes stop_codon:yes gene_type:complete